jgi:hypothetical protein
MEKLQPRRGDVELAVDVALRQVRNGYPLFEVVKSQMEVLMPTR